MDVRFCFLVTISVILQVMWPTSGLKLSLCNITSKSVPFKISPKSPIVQNATPLQIGPTCPKCPTSIEPNLQPQAINSREGIFLSPSYPSSNEVSLSSENSVLTSPNLLRKTSNTNVALNPSLSELTLRQNLLRNSQNNLEKLPLEKSASNSPSVTSNKAVNTLNGVNNLNSLKTVTEVAQGSSLTAPNINNVLNNLPINTLHPPLKQTKPVGTNIESQNITPNKPSVKAGNMLNLVLPSDQISVLRNGIPEFSNPYNVVLNNPVMTSSNAVNINKFSSSENNIASSKFSPVLGNAKINSNVLELTHELPIPYNLYPSTLPNKAVNNGILSKQPSLYADTSKSPVINIPLNSRISSLNTVPTSSIPAVKNSIQNNLSIKEYKPFYAPNLENLSLNPVVSQYEIQNKITQVPKMHIPVVSNENNAHQQILKTNAINEKPVAKTNPTILFKKESPKQDSIIRNSAIEIPINIVESSFGNKISNDLAQITNSNINMLQESLLTPKNPSSIHINPNIQSPNTVLPTNQANNANLNRINNLSSIPDFNNIDAELWATILSQLQNPVSIKNNEYSVPKITATSNINNNILKPVEPLPVSNNVEIIDFPNLISPKIIPFYPTNNMAPFEISNNIQCTPQKISLGSEGIPSVEFNEPEVPQKVAIIKNENNSQYKLPALPIHIDPVINKINTNFNKLPLSLNTIPEVIPTSPVSLSANSLDITQLSLNNLPISSRSPSLFINAQSLNDIDTNKLSYDVSQKSENVLSTNLNNKFENIKTLSPHVNPISNVVFKQPNLVSTSSKPEVQLSPALTVTNIDSNSIVSANSNLLQNTGSIVSSSNGLISPIAVQKQLDNRTQNPSIITTETSAKAFIGNNFAEFVPSSVTENVRLKSHAPENSQKLPHSMTSVGNLPSVNAPKYTPPGPILNYAKINPSLVPQTDKLISTSDITKPLNDMAAEVTRRYANLVRQKLDSKPTVSPKLIKPLPISNAVLPKTESGSISQSEVLHTPSVAPTSLFIPDNLSPNPYTTGNSIPLLATSAIPTSPTLLTDNVSTISSPTVSNTPMFSEQIDTPTTNLHLSPVTINAVSEKPPVEIAVPTYLPTVDYKFLPSPIYPVMPPYPIPPMLPPIIEAPILKTSCKESQDFKKILEILVLNELINGNNEFKDRSTLETIIALLCAT